MLLKGTAQTCRWLLLDILPGLRLIDPSCGSGAFLAAAMRKLISIYTGLIGPVKMRFAGDTTLRDWLRGIEANHPSIEYYIKKQIIVNNLYGVDLMDEAVDIARLRLFLALVASANSVDDLEPLPNIDFNVLQGNALVGLLRVDEAKAEKGIAAQVAQSSLWSGQSQQSYRAIVEEKNRLVRAYRNTAQTLRAEDLHVLRDDIQAHRAQAYDLLDALLLDDFQALGVKYEQATWDEAKNQEGKPQRRSLTLADIRALHPFHWGYEFDEVMNERRGFDAIITNPPWEALKPQDKEFFSEYSNAISKNKMRIEDLDREKATLLRDPVTREAYLAYLSNFPFQSEYFRSAAQFANQQSVVNGRRTGTDVNLYKLFTEQCFNLLRADGQCGVVLPSGVYTDLGAKQLRVLLFEQTRIEGLICFENRKNIFDGVDSRFKIAILTFRKGGATGRFPAAFMRQDVTQLVDFPRPDDLRLTIKLIERFSPDSLSLVEFQSAMDITISERMTGFPLLGKYLEDTWNARFGTEFHMTNDHHLFMGRAMPGSLPLYEGKMIHQFTDQFAEPRYWVDEAAGRRAVLGKLEDVGQRLAYQQYRLAFRDIARGTDTRTFIATILHPNVFCGNTVILEKDAKLPYDSQLCLLALFNSFVVDYLIRQRVTTHLSFFYVYQLPVPRLTQSDPRFRAIAERAARLICVTPEYDALAATVGLGDHHAGVTDPAARNAIRAELDALVAQLYGLSEEELAHILTTFPNVEQAQKSAVMDAFRALAPNVSDLAVAQFIAQGESDAVEFKVAAAWNAKLGQEDRNGMPAKVVQAVASFLNSRKGGNVIIGVDDKGQVVGIADDIAHADPKRQDCDGYERYLRSKINDVLGASKTLHYAVSFHSVAGCEVCLIAVDPAPGPVYDQYGDLYVRDGNGKKKLSAQQAQEYIKHHWPS